MRDSNFVLILTEVHVLILFNIRMRECNLNHGDSLTNFGLSRSVAGYFIIFQKVISYNEPSTSNVQLLSK